MIDQIAGEPLKVADTTETPYLALDLDRVRNNVDRVRTAFGSIEPALYYAVKAIPEPALLAMLRDEGCGFDVASVNEIRQVQALGVPGSRVTFGAPVKIPSHIEEARARGIDCFAYDSPTEVEKHATLAPGARVVLRVEVPQRGTRWPLAGKFGVPPDQAVELLRHAQQRGLRPHGLTFHVGSQCVRPGSWVDAINACAPVWDHARSLGLDLRLVNIGGGIPARYTEDIPSWQVIGAKSALAARRAFGGNVEFAIEPGRSLVADAGTLVTRVIGKATRAGKPWVFVDLSIYAGLLEVIEGWSYPIRTAKDDLPKHRTTLAGPSCDSTDILARDIDLPELEVGDRLLLLSAGAYTTSYREYNGIAFPKVIATSTKKRLAIAAA
jgi:ornithine decarboxylase